MRKVFLLISFMVVVRLVSGEQMQFVTTLSHPVGTFATVEALDETKTVQSLQVNFCNQKVSTGSIQLKGAMRAAYLKTLPNTQLGGSVPAYQLKTLYLGDNNTLTGGNVVANTANPAKADVSGTLYGPDMSYLVAELPGLEIKDGSTVKAKIRSGGNGAELQWSNKYECNYETSEDDSAGVWVKEGSPEPWGKDSWVIDTCDSDLNKETSASALKSVSETSCFDYYRFSDLEELYSYVEISLNQTPAGRHLDPIYEFAPCQNMSFSNFKFDTTKNYEQGYFSAPIANVKADWKQRVLTNADVAFSPGGALGTYISRWGYDWEKGNSYAQRFLNTFKNHWSSHTSRSFAVAVACNSSKVDVGGKFFNAYTYRIAYTALYAKQKWVKKSDKEIIQCIDDGKKYDSYLLKSK